MERLGNGLDRTTNRQVFIQAQGFVDQRIRRRLRGRETSTERGPPKGHGESEKKKKEETARHSPRRLQEAAIGIREPIEGSSEGKTPLLTAFTEEEKADGLTNLILRTKAIAPPCCPPRERS